jgi:ribosomal protein S27E
MTAVTLACPLCAGNIQVDDSLAGQQVACPLCHGALMLPPAEVLAQFAQPQFPPGYQQPPPEQLFSLGCPACNNPLQVTAAMSGQQVACPYCSTPIIIPPLQPPQQWDAPVEAVVEHQPLPVAGGYSSHEEADLSSLLPPGAEALPRSPSPPPAGKAVASKPPEPTAADRLPPTRSQPPPRTKVESRPTSPPASDRLPPGMGGPKPRAPEQRDDRLPPPRKDIVKEAVAKQEPPTKVEKLDERLPPPRREPASKVEVKPEPAKLPEPEPAIDDLLPPGALPTGALPPGVLPPTLYPQQPPSVPPTKMEVELPVRGSAGASPSQEVAPSQQKAPSPIDHLLPPGAMEVNTAVAGRSTQPQPTSMADVLLPPGAAAGPIAAGVPGTEVPLPKMQAGPLRPVFAPGQSLTPQGIDAIQVGSKKDDEEPLAEIKKLTPEQRASRRFRRNAILASVCLVILYAVFYFMSR